MKFCDTKPMVFVEKKTQSLVFHSHAGVKKSLVLEPGTSKTSIRTSKNFHPMSDGQVKKYSGRLYFLECPALFGNRTSKNLGVLVRRTSEHFKKFLPLT